MCFSYQGSPLFPRAGRLRRRVKVSAKLWSKVLAQLGLRGFIFLSSSEEHNERSKSRPASVAASWSWLGFATCGYSRLRLALSEHWETFVG